MKSILSRPNFWFFIVAPLFFFIMRWLVNGHSLHVRFQDEFYLIHLNVLVSIVSAIWVLWGVLHTFSSKVILNKPAFIIATIHFWSSLILAVLVLAGLSYQTRMNTIYFAAPARMIIDNIASCVFSIDVISALIIFFLLAQVCFFMLYTLLALRAK